MRIYIQNLFRALENCNKGDIPTLRQTPRVNRACVRPKGKQMYTDGDTSSQAMVGIEFEHDIAKRGGAGEEDNREQ